MQLGAAYIRVSTEDQLEFSPDAQKRAIIDYSIKNNIVLKEEFIYIDEGISGRNAEKRPYFMKMIADAKKKPRPFDIILVHKFDRFARSREDSVVYKSLLRKECGIKVISITEQMEDDKFSIILESMLEAMAEYYSLNLSDEVKKGLFEKARRGEHIGRSPYGYVLKEKKLIPIPFEIEIVKKIFDLAVNKGYSLTKISQYLNQHSIPTKYGSRWRNCTIKYILSNPVYIGYTRYNYKKPDGISTNPPENWILAKSSHPAALDEITFHKAQDISHCLTTLGKNHSYFNNKTKKIVSWCQHLVFCSECGSKLILHSSGKGNYYSFSCPYSSCSGAWSIKKIEKQILQSINSDLALSFPLLIQRKHISNYNSEKKLIMQQLKKLNNKKNMIKQAFLAEIDSIDDYKNNKFLLEKEEKIFLQELDHFSQAESALSTNQKMNPYYSNFYDILSSNELSTDEKNSIAKTFIKQIKLNLKKKESKIIYYVV